MEEGGRKPVAPEPGPRPKDQVNFTDGDSRIMPKSGGDFVQGYNAQTSVDQPTMIIVGQHVTQNTNDKQEVEPALAELNKLPEKLGKVERAALDNGYFSDDNVNTLVIAFFVLVKYKRATIKDCPYKFHRFHRWLFMFNPLGVETN